MSQSTSAVTKQDRDKLRIEELRAQAVKKVVTRRGTPYEVTKEDLEGLRSFRGKEKHSGHFVSRMEATMEILNHNDLGREPTPNEVAAIARLHATFSIEEWHPDVVIKGFHDLDTIFFGGHLRGNVCVCWADAGIIHENTPRLSLERLRQETVSSPRVVRNPLDALLAAGQKKLETRKASGREQGIPGQWGITWPYLPGQSYIVLNAGTIMNSGRISTGANSEILSPRVRKWMVLLHEMCHAYDRVRTSRTAPPDGTDGHGKHFGTKLEAVNERWNKLFGACAFTLERRPYERFHPSELSDGASEVVSEMERTGGE